jgi:hypothetical protein
MVFFHKHTLNERSPILDFNIAQKIHVKEDQKASIHVTKEQQSEIDYLQAELIASHVYSMNLKRLSDKHSDSHYPAITHIAIRC